MIKEEEKRRREERRGEFESNINGDCEQLLSDDNNIVLIARLAIGVNELTAVTRCLQTKPQLRIVRLMIMINGANRYVGLMYSIVI